MTIESPLAHNRPPDDFSRQVKFNSNRENSSSPTTFFHDYARHTTSDNERDKLIESKKMTSQFRDASQNLRPLFIIPDHSLAADWSVHQSTSPDSTFMYEDVADRDTKGALLSPCTSESPGYRRDGFDPPCDDEESSINLSDMSTVSLSSASCNASGLPLTSTDEVMCLWGQMDGPPIQDYLSDLINSEDGSSIKDIGDALAACIKTEDPLRVGLKDCSGGPGPTLAQLNDRESVLDIMVTPSNGTGSRWIPPTAVVQPVTTEIWTGNYPSYNAKNKLTSNSRPSAVRPSSSATLASSGLLPSGYTANQSDRGTQPKMAVPRPSASLQQLLQTPTPVKKEPEEAKSCGSMTRKRSRTQSDSDEDSNGSMERKWEEIRCYIDSNIKLEEAAANKALAQQKQEVESPTTTPVKRIKMEPGDSSEPLLKSSSTKQAPPASEFKITPVENRQEYANIKDEYDSDFDNSDDDFSDVDSDASYGSFIDDLLHGSHKKEKRYFWQYNTQSKGPKGKRLCKSMTEADPHSLADFEDPVFQPDVNDARYKHNGKARKGDGNDITPSPWKLFQIGNELQKLNKKINGIAMTEKPQRTKDGVKSKSRKEKNKYASRACRLKKKAQHEANKLKLYGLEQEHHQLMEVLKTIKRRVYNRIKHNEITAGETSFCAMLEGEVKENLTVMIAGNTSDYVNAVLQKVAEGDKSGGITRG